MKRIEYMTKLASMLQDIPVEERQEAMKYYNDYFDEAGEENEEKVAEELDSPEKVAAEIKKELYGRIGQDTVFEKIKSENQQYRVPEYCVNKQKNGNSWWKIILFVIGGLAVLVGAGPFVLAIALTFVAVLMTGFIALIALVIGAGSILIVGVGLFIAGLTQIASALPVAFALIGTGMILFAAGLIGVVLLVRLCIIAFPVMFRGIVKICKKPFQRKVVLE